MTWDEYVSAKAALKIDDDNPPILVMAGVAGDNATRYLLDQKGSQFPNDQNLFQIKGIGNSDFVWTGEHVRAHTGFSSGGHPALAGFSTIHCAGVIKADYFFFHSGHYHPELPHALHFFSDFVNNTCQGLNGNARDRKVDELSQIALKLYVDGSETETYRTTFARLAARDAVPKPSTATRGLGSAPMSIGIPRSMPISMGTSSPILIGESPSIRLERSADSPGQLAQETGIDAYGRHQLKVRIEGAPPWIHDTARTECALCKAKFGTFTWKHHCRRCGEIVCDDCSKHRKNVKHPARDPRAKEAEKQPVRVCNLCNAKQDLL